MARDTSESLGARLPSGCWHASTGPYGPVDRRPRRHIISRASLLVRHDFSPPATDAGIFRSTKAPWTRVASDANGTRHVQVHDRADIT